VTRWIVDNSVWARADTSARIRRRIDELTADPHNLMLSCPPQVLEYCFSARSSAEYAQLREDMELLSRPRYTPTVDDVLEIQEALFRRGLGRAVGVSDIMLAAWARANDAVVLSADHDFDHVARAVPGFLHEYVAPS
jgi:predicted nucleic acid-binding protein